MTSAAERYRILKALRWEPLDETIGGVAGMVDRLAATSDRVWDGVTAEDRPRVGREALEALADGRPCESKAAAVMYGIAAAEYYGDLADDLDVAGRAPSIVTAARVEIGPAYTDVTVMVHRMVVREALHNLHPSV